MNRTTKDATINRYHYDSHAQLRAHVVNFAITHKSARRLKTQRGLTPYGAICEA